jgi:hypothetical protein
VIGVRHFRPDQPSDPSPTEPAGRPAPGRTGVPGSARIGSSTEVAGQWSTPKRTTSTSDARELRDSAIRAPLVHWFHGQDRNRPHHGTACETLAPSLSARPSAPAPTVVLSAANSRKGAPTANRSCPFSVRGGRLSRSRGIPRRRATRNIPWSRTEFSASRPRRARARRASKCRPGFGRPHEPRTTPTNTSSPRWSGNGPSPPRTPPAEPETVSRRRDTTGPPRRAATDDTDFQPPANCRRESPGVLSPFDQWPNCDRCAKNDRD